MPGFEFFGEEERKEVNDVLSTGILMRYGFDTARKGIWKSLELEQALCTRLNCGYAQLTSSGTSALTTALAALGSSPSNGRRTLSASARKRISMAQNVSPIELIMHYLFAT